MTSGLCQALPLSPLHDSLPCTLYETVDMCKRLHWGHHSGSLADIALSLCIIVLWGSCCVCPHCMDVKTEAWKGDWSHLHRNPQLESGSSEIGHGTIRLQNLPSGFISSRSCQAVCPPRLWCPSARETSTPRMSPSVAGWLVGCPPSLKP